MCDSGLFSVLAVSSLFSLSFVQVSAFLYQEFEARVGFKRKRKCCGLRRRKSDYVAGLMRP
jgi:hypothetical protein